MLYVFSRIEHTVGASFIREYGQKRIHIVLYYAVLIREKMTQIMCCKLSVG